MDRKFIESIAAAWQEVAEKKKLDPVGKADKDIDNDGDVDSSDEYLHNRRATIKKKMKHSKSGKLGHKDLDEAEDNMTPCPDCDGSMENHDPDCAKAPAADKKKLAKEQDLDKGAEKAMKHDCASHVASESWGFGECIPGQHTLVEQEDGTAIVTHYDVMFEHGVEFNVPVEELTIMQEKSHLHANKKIKESVFSDDKRREHEKAADHHADQASHHTTQMNQKKKDGAHPSEYDHHKVLAKMHDKAQASHAKAVVHSRRGEHEKARSASTVASAHSDNVKKKAATYEQVVHEDSRAKHYKGAAKAETMKDKRKGKAADDMAKDHDADSPEVKKDANKEALKTAQAVGVSKQAPARNGDQRKGDLSVVRQGGK